VTISHAITEFEFHISPAFSSSRPQTGLRTVAIRSSNRRATVGSLLSRREPPTAWPRSGIDPPRQQRTS